MEDLISSLSGTMHVSQDAYELEAFKASLARSLSAPPSPSQSSNGYSSPSTRPSSLSLSTYPYEDEAELAAAFAGDAFAPMWNNSKPPAQSANVNGQWRAFHQSGNAPAFQGVQYNNAPAQAMGVNMGMNIDPKAQR